MNINPKEIWIKKGYEIFALLGQNGLKVEYLAKEVSISKSSFYHHFADLELFMDELLNYHISQSYLIAEKELNANNLNPELINILVEHKIDLLFNRQLRFNRDNKNFLDCLIQSNQIVGNSFVMLWMKELDLKFSQKQLESIFELALENFYLQINTENLNREWLTDYFNNLKKILNNFNS